MHSASLHNQFLRLRIQGLSLARIGRQLGISKPTLIKWNRQSRTEIDLQTAADRLEAKQEATATAAEEIVELRRKIKVLRQELISRALRDTPTADLETLSGEFRQRLEALEHISPDPSSLNPQLSASAEPLRTVPNPKNLFSASEISVNPVNQQ
jgi:transposase-like protein